MKRLAYGTWDMMMQESLVRAGVVRYLANYKGETTAQAEIAKQHRLGFTWTQDLADLLAQYERQRETYPTLADFMPKIINFFDAQASAMQATTSPEAGDIREQSQGGE